MSTDEQQDLRLLRLATGALHPHLEFGIRGMPIVVPPAEEQEQIVTHVNEQRVKIDITVHQLVRQIELLAEHRRGLIAAAVTGLQEIPGTAA